jgi:hypothetical protein
MPKAKTDAPEFLDSNTSKGFEQTDSAEDNSEAVATVATVAVVGIGAASGLRFCPA